MKLLQIVSVLFMVVGMQVETAMATVPRYQVQPRDLRPHQDPYACTLHGHLDAELRRHSHIATTSIAL